MTAGTPGWDEICNWSMRKRVAAAGNDYTAPDVLALLAKWAVEDLDRSMVAFDSFPEWKPGVPEEKDADILSALVKNPNLPAEAVERIIASGWWRLRPAALFHPAVTIDGLGEALDDLIDVSSNHLWMGASFSAAVEAWCSAISQHPDYSPHLWDPVIEAARGIPRLLAFIAGRRDITPQQYRTLLSMQNELVVRRLAGNPHAPADVRVMAVLMANAPLS